MSNDYVSDVRKYTPGVNEAAASGIVRAWNPESRFGRPVLAAGSRHRVLTLCKCIKENGAPAHAKPPPSQKPLRLLSAVELGRKVTRHFHTGLCLSDFGFEPRFHGRLLVVQKICPLHIEFGNET